MNGITYQSDNNNNNNNNNNKSNHNNQTIIGRNMGLQFNTNF